MVILLMMISLSLLTSCGTLNKVYELRKPKLPSSELFYNYVSFGDDCFKSFIKIVEGKFIKQKKSIKVAPKYCNRGYLRFVYGPKAQNEIEFLIRKYYETYKDI